MRRRTVDVVAFDVNETLFSLDRLGPAFAEVGLDPRSVPLWFARVLRDGFCLTVVGQFARFADIAAEQLRAIDPEKVDDGSVASVMEAFHELEPFPEAEAALKLLRDAGVRVVTLTNGGADWIRRLLERANLDSYVEQNLSVEAVRRWKPAPDVYLLAAQATGVSPDRVALVSAHAHDCDGARRAGLRTARIARINPTQPAHFLPADIVGPDLTTVVRQLLIPGVAA